MSTNRRFLERDWGWHGRDASRYLYRTVVFQEPDRLASPLWLEHIPFGFWIVDALRPECLVELGTGAGNSYAAFAQAVNMLHLPTACTSIDTPDAGFDEWVDYHDRHFSAFSNVVRAPSFEAVREFADGSVDLLHLCPGRAMDDLQQDLSMWLPKMSSAGVMLLADITLRERGAGGRHVWRQVERSYPSFAFLHGGGLGVLGVGREVPEPLQWLFSRASGSPEEVADIRLFFSQLGRRLSLQFECSQYQQSAETARSRMRGTRDDAEPESQRLAALELRLQSEREVRDRTIGELDAEARALAGRLDRVRTELSRRVSPGERLAIAARGLSARIWRSRLGRIITIFRAAPEILSLAAAQGGRNSIRAIARFVIRPTRLGDAAVVARSGLFDHTYYLSHYPDVAGTNLNPLVHYVLHGAFEGRRPNMLFEPSYYMEQYPDVARAGHEALSHFVRYGASEMRNPGPNFDIRYYVAMNPDVRESGKNPLAHFLEEGWQEGRSPSPAFDFSGYAARYEDVRSPGADPLIHYLEIGQAQGRSALPLAGAALPAQPRVRLTAQPISPPQTSDSLPVVLCLTHVCPWPPRAGNSYRIYRLLQWLRHSGYRVVPVIAPLAGEEPDDQAIDTIHKLFSNVVVIGRDGQIRYALSDVPDVLASLDGDHTPRYSTLLGEESRTSTRERELLTIDRNYCHDAAIAAVLRLHSVLGKYVLLAEYVWMTRLLPLVDGRAIKVIDTHDVFSTKKDKVLRYGIPGLWLDPKEEARRLALADLVVAIQPEEQELLQRLVPRARVVTATIDFEPVGDPSLPDTHKVLYVGSDNQMNVRGLREFLRFAWPTILAKVPDATLVVAGGVSESIDSDIPGVKALGRVDDLDSLYASVRVVINPALAGTGIKIKTVEALSRHRPIVTWPTGVDGLPADLKALCDVAQDWYEFGPLVVARLVDGRTEAFSQDERKRIASATSPEVVYADFCATLAALYRRRS